MSLILPLLFSILAILLSYVLYNRIRHFQLFTDLGIPGPPPSIFTGNMTQIRSEKTCLMDVMTEWESIYGSIYGYFTGIRPMLVIKDLEILKEVLVKNSRIFIDRPHMVINSNPLPHTLVGLRGNRWKEVRAMLSPTFSSAKMKQMVPIISDSLETTLKILEKKNCEEIDAYKLFQGLTCDVISGCALAMKVDSQVDENDRFLKAIKGFLRTAFSPFIKVALCLPIVARLAEWGLKTFGYSHEMTQMIVESVKTAMDFRRKEKEGRHVDALQLMLDYDKYNFSYTEGGNNNNVKPLSDDEIIANAWVFILGGFETTAANLSFTSYLLAQHQDVQERLFKEIEETFREDESPSYEQVNDLKYLDQIVCESLRLYPPVVSFVVRRIEEDVQIGPYKVPSGLNIQIPVWQIHHCSQLWPEPYHFNPDRFSQSGRKSRHPMAFIPFGKGPRACIGSRFATLETKFALARIIRKFKILPAEQPVKKLRFTVPTVSIVPIDKIILRFELRSSKVD